MENKTAVEWLFEQIEDSVNGRCEWEGKWHSLEDTKQKAIELEKEQIIQTYKIAQVNVMINATVRAEQYYFETYKKPEPDES